MTIADTEQFITDSDAPETVKLQALGFYDYLDCFGVFHANTETFSHAVVLHYNPNKVERNGRSLRLGTYYDGKKVISYIEGKDTTMDSSIHYLNTETGNLFTDQIDKAFKWMQKGQNLVLQHQTALQRILGASE
jgi:hypothetical protein